MDNNKTTPGFTPADVTIITVSYNSSPVIAQMLPSVPEACRVVIVDNAGNDAVTLDTLAQTHGAEVVHNKENLGFGVACNVGLAAAKTRFVFFLNPDTTLREGAIEALLRAAETYGPDAAFNPRIFHPNGRAYFKRRSALLPKSEWMGRGHPPADCDVPVLSGSAIFTARETCLQFDPQIFMYFEDDDWSLRMHDAGRRIMFIHAAEIEHHAGHSSGRSPEITAFKAYYLGQSRCYAMKKHGMKYVIVSGIFHALLAFLSPINLLSKRKRAKNIAFLRGVLSAA